ncbi:MAG: hypothetical protein H0X33_13390 [Taibaiella sp.]|nr:hypothetical protein [Taibaiella sp.]
MTKVRKNFRLSPEAETILDTLVAKFGPTETGVVELALRRLAEQEDNNRKENTMSATFKKAYPEIEGFRGYKPSAENPEVMVFYYRSRYEPGIVGFDHDPIFDYIGHHIPRILEDTATGKPLSELEGLDRYGQPKEGVSEWPRKDPLENMASDTEIELAGHKIKKVSFNHNGGYSETFYII